MKKTIACNISRRLLLSAFFTVFYLLFSLGQAEAEEETELSAKEHRRLQALIKEEYERSIESATLDAAQFQGVKALVAAAERYRGNIERDFVFTLNVVETLNNTEKSRSALKVYVHLLDNRQKRHVISQFLSGRSVNTLVLQRNYNMWFYKPGTRNPIRISPAQRLMGGASYADVSNTNYTEYYDPVDIRSVTVGKTAAYKVALQKKERGVAYEKIEYYLKKTDQRPIKANFYSRSKRLVKSMYFRKFESLQNRTIAREWVIVDGINKKAVTYIQVEALNYETLAPSLFTPERIKEF